MSATVQALLADAEQRLQASPTVRLDAELLLARTTGCRCSAGSAWR